METIHNRIKNLIGYPLTLTLRGPLTVEGFILDVKLDYIIFEDLNNIQMYVPQVSIKEVKKSSKKLFHPIKVINEIKKNSFKDLLRSLKERWLYVKRVGIDHFEGVLCEIYLDYATFVFDESVLYVPLNEMVLVKEIDGNEKATESENNISENNIDEQEQNDEVDVENKKQKIEDEGIKEVKISENIISKNNSIDNNQNENQSLEEKDSQNDEKTSCNKPEVIKETKENREDVQPLIEPIKLIDKNDYKFLRKNGRQKSLFYCQDDSVKCLKRNNNMKDR